MDLVDKIIDPNMRDTGAMELAYGLLWMVGCDRSTKAGEALYLARKVLYEKMDRAGQARGITAARAALGTDHITPGERSDAYRPSLPVSRPGPSMTRTSAPVFPCSCTEGWKPEGWAYCAECYEGKIERLVTRLSDVVMMLDAPDAYNREYIAAVCRSILSSTASQNGVTP